MCSLADRLRGLLADGPPAGSLTAFGQLLVAADRLSRADLEAWKLDRADEAVLPETAADPLTG